MFGMGNMESRKSVQSHEEVQERRRVERPLTGSIGPEAEAPTFGIMGPSSERRLEVVLPQEGQPGYEEYSEMCKEYSSEQRDRLSERRQPLSDASFESGESFSLEHEYPELAKLVAQRDETVVKVVTESLYEVKALVREKEDLWEQYGPGTNVGAFRAEQLVTRVEQMLERVQGTLSGTVWIDDRQQFEQFFPNVAQDIKQNRADIEDVNRNISDEQIAPSSKLDNILNSAIRLGLSTVAGAVVGGPVISFALGEPVLDKMVEGAFGGLAGGVATEVGMRLPGNQSRSR